MNRYCVFLFGLWFCFAPVVQAHGFELFGKRFFERKKENVEDVVGNAQNYTVEFDVVVPDTEPGDADGLEDQVRNASQLLADSERPASGPGGLIVKARGDYLNILAALYRAGYYGGSINILIEGREASDTSPDTQLPNPANIRVTVNTGPPYRFGSVRIINPAPETAKAPRRRGAIGGKRRPELQEGTIARSGLVLEAETAELEAWRNAGFPKVEIKQRRVTAVHPKREVNVTIDVAPGRRAMIGPLSVTGTERMDPSFILQQTGLKPGRLYTPEELRRAREKLDRLDVFQSLRFQEADKIGADGLLPITIAVQERKLRRVGVGGSFSSIDGIAAEAFWLHRNLFGRAEQLRFDARLEEKGQNITGGNLSAVVGATFTRPGTFTPDTDLVLGLNGGRVELENYRETFINARAGVAHVFSPRLEGTAALRFKYSDVDDDLGNRQFSLFSLPATLESDQRNDRLDTTEGHFLELTAEPFHEFEFNNTGFRVTGEARGYFPLAANDSIILAGRVKLGSILGVTIEETSPDQLFFAGGDVSVRGYAFRGIGIRSSEGIVTGGRSLLEGSVELRSRVTETIGIVLFSDAGLVGEDEFPDFEQQTRFAAGAGLRYATGVGPIRADLAFPLNRLPGGIDFGLYIGIGQAF